MLGRTKLSLPVCSLSTRAAVGRVGAVQRMDEAEVVHAFGHVRKQFADPMPLSPCCCEFPGRVQQVAGRGELHARLGERQRLAVVAVEKRLVIERIDVRRPALHEQEDDPFRPGWKVRRLRAPADRRSRRRCRQLPHPPAARPGPASRSRRRIRRSSYASGEKWNIGITSPLTDDDKRLSLHNR